MRGILYSIIILCLFTACDKEEELLPGRFLSDFVGEANMVSEGGIDYQMQLYFDLSSATLKAQNVRDVWDLAIGCDPEKPNLFVNPSMLVSVAATGTTDFNAEFNPGDYAFSYERSDRFYHRGFMASDFENGKPKGEVYIINLGRRLDNQRRGFLLFKILDYNEGLYRLRISDLNRNQVKDIEVKSDLRFNFVYLSLENPDEILNLEPPKEEWDLHFSKYMALLYDGEDSVDYSVTGCLINPYKTEAYYDENISSDSAVKYNKFKIEDVDESLFTGRSDVIGHEWKDFDLDRNSFMVFDQMIYIIKDIENIIYRLHFIGFYDEDGNKGAVQFEYLPLNGE